MSEPVYRISNAAVVSDQLRAALARAEATGVSRIAVGAAKWLVSELERTPFEFGESREHLPHADLHMRIVFIPPLYAVFGIHEPSQTVFVSKVGWLERKPKA